MPDGQITLSTRPGKDILIFRISDLSYELRDVSRSSRHVGGMRWTQAGVSARQSQGEHPACERYASHGTTGAKALRSLPAKQGGLVRQDRMVGAPDAGVKSCGDAIGLSGRVASAIRKATVATELVSPGRSRHKPSNRLRGDGRDVSAALWVFPLCFIAHVLRTAGRGCQPAPDLPCTLLVSRGEETQQSSGEPCREDADVRLMIVDQECRRMLLRAFFPNTLA